MYGGSTTSVARYPVGVSPRGSYVSQARRIEAAPVVPAEPVIIVPVEGSVGGRSRRSSRAYY